MSDLLKDLKIVVLDNPSNTWSEGLTRDLFVKTIGLKLKGYGVEYAPGVLPIDTTDFFGVHQLVCRQTKEGLLPLMGYRSTTLERCRFYGQTFPGLALVRAAQAPEHEAAVQELLHQCEAQGRAIAYTGSWTIDPEVRKNAEMAHLMNEIFAAMYVLSHVEADVKEIITGGTLRFKVNRMLEKWGHEYLTHKGARLGPIHVANLVAEPVAVMHLREFTNNILEEVKAWRFFWKNRITISEQPTTHATKKAA